MNICVIGTGYVGLVTGACFADFGNHVCCVDSDAQKVSNLKQGIIPIYEPSLKDLVIHNLQEERLSFTTDLRQGLDGSDICFIAVGTPMGADGSADLQYVLAVAADIGRYVQQDIIVVDKSTVPVGTGEKVYQVITDELRKRSTSHQVRVVSNPEFLKEGSAVADCMAPDRVVLGVPDRNCEDVMRELYAPVTRNRECVYVMDVKSAEMTKYASNAMLATRISFMNELANLCERVGADINQVRLGMGSDRRIGYSFLYAGCGYGGSCFPKDVQAIIKTAKDHGCTAGILEQVEAVNRRQKMVLVNKIVARFGEDLSGKAFGIWGLAFKPNTDDMRDAPSLVVIPELLRRGATVFAYDPKSIKAAQRYLEKSDNLYYLPKRYAVLEEADALVLLTEWKEFRSPDFSKMKHAMNTPIIFDGRNQYKPSSMKKQGFEYYPIGSPV